MEEIREVIDYLESKTENDTVRTSEIKKLIEEKLPEYSDIADDIQHEIEDFLEIDGYRLEVEDD